MRLSILNNLTVPIMLLRYKYNNKIINLRNISISTKDIGESISYTPFCGDFIKIKTIIDPNTEIIKHIRYSFDTNYCGSVMWSAEYFSKYINDNQINIRNNSLHSDENIISKFKCPCFPTDSSILFQDALKDGIYNYDSKNNI